MSVHKEKNGGYYVKYKNKTIRGFKTKKEAKIYEAKLEAQSIENENNIKIYDVMDDFLNYYEKEVAFTTFDRTRRIVEQHIKPNIRNRSISKISEKEAREFYELVHSFPLSTTYKNDIFNTYRRIFIHSFKFFGVTNNPTKVFDSYKSTREEKMQKNSKDFNTWIDEDFNRFIIRVTNTTYKIFFIVLYYTGLRLGEALALNWSDFKDNYLDINKNIPKLTNNGEIVVKEPKNVSSIRKIKLNQTLISILNNYKERQMEIPGYNENWYIFGNTKPLSRSTIGRAKDKAIKESNVKRITIHDFRHSHASNLIADGVNIVSISRRLGHSNVEMTLNTYAHLLSKTDDEMIQKIENSSQNLLTGTLEY